MMSQPQSKKLSGAEIILEVLREEQVRLVFGYPGGAVLPLYDCLFGKDWGFRHILVRHEQGAVHAAEGYARSTGDVGVVLVTSGPGATNTVTGLTDAFMDSIPVVCLTGQVATQFIGNDAFQEADTTGITRPCTKHNYLVKDVSQLASVMREAFHVAREGRPGPVVVDLPKDVQVAQCQYNPPDEDDRQQLSKRYHVSSDIDGDAISQAIGWIGEAQKPIFYVGGGMINAGRQACEALRSWVKETGFPITQTLMGLGAYPTANEQFLGMLGMHGTYEANMAMHQCDVMIAIGARFDDRITGRLRDFSPNSRKIHIDIDASSINKSVLVDCGIRADAGVAVKTLAEAWRQSSSARQDLSQWWKTIEGWRARRCLSYKNSKTTIKPQYALQRLDAALKKHGDYYITTEVGQHQMWAAQFLTFNEPHRWMTSGGLGTMGYGFPSAIGVQLAHPQSLVVDVAGEASILMNIQELSTAMQYRLPVKIFIMNNQYMGMVRQWQELIYDNRLSESYTDSLPDFVKLAESFGAKGLRASSPDELDAVIDEMIESPRLVVADIVVDKVENCFPMIPSGAAHHEMLLSDEDEQVFSPDHKEEGMILV